MRKLLLAVLLLSFTAFAREGKEALTTQDEGAALTIYNQNFAVVRQLFPLALKAGENRITFSGATAHIEPDSVILRDPFGKRQFQIFEQNYRNDPVSQERLLALFEGKTIDFLVKNQDKPDEIVKGKIIRSGYVPHYEAMNRYGQQYYQAQMAYAGQTSQPIIEVNGKLQFFLPGLPLFPALGDDTILKPRLDWLLRSDGSSDGQAEVSYISGGMSWDAAYNIVAPEKGDVIDLIGWVTLDNQSGTDFRNAQGYGTQSNPKVWVMQEFKNSKENNLGMPLPAGRLRFYRRDTDGTLQFTGENKIDHTPKDETVRVYTGNSFDLVGERSRTDYRIDVKGSFLDESFQIKVRNHKKEPATIRVVEHLYRWVNWRIINPTSTFKKKDSRTIEFTVTVPPDGEKVISYTAHYT